MVLVKEYNITKASFKYDKGTPYVNIKLPMDKPFIVNCTHPDGSSILSDFQIINENTLDIMLDEAADIKITIFFKED